MPRTKISEFSVTPGDNTDIDGINIAEGCAPSGINDAIRELMAQLKDFQSGAAGDNITVVGTLAAKGTSSSGADLKLYEDTDNGTNYVGFIAPASIASNVQWTLPSADGSSGQALQTNGSGTLSFATLGISAGGTGQTTANAAFNALAPSQTSNAGRYLKTDGTNTSWDLLDISTADITGTLPVANGGTGITSFGTGVATALGINVGSSGAFVTNGGALGTPSSGTVTNLTGTASININGTVGATTPNTGSFTTLTTSSTVTHNGGTANGVAYLNGSKVLTTGSALTFDGTNFATTGTASATKFIATGGTATGNGMYLPAANTLAFSTNGAERIRVDSSGLVGIGTSSPTRQLDVSGAGQNIARFTSSGASTSLGLDNTNANAWGSNISFATGGTISGYFGTIGGILGNTTQDLAAYANTGNGFRVYTNGNNLRAIVTSAGDVGIGTSSPGYRLEVSSGATDANTLFNSTSANGAHIRFAASGTVKSYIGSSPGFITLSGSTADDLGIRAVGSILFATNGSSVDMNLDTAGNLGLGVTPSAWGSVSRAMQFQNGVSIFSNSSGLGGLGNNVYSNPGTADYYIATGFATRYYQFNGTHVWNTAASGNAGDTISFTQALTLDANRNLLLNGTTAGTSSVGTLTIFNGTAPTGSVTDGVILFAQDVSASSELRVRDEAGNVTTLSPHNFELIPEGPSEDMAWAYYSEKNGKKINVDMLKLARMVEKLTGEKLVYEA